MFYTFSKKQDCFTADFIQYGTIWRANAAFATYDRKKSERLKILEALGLWQTLETAV